MLSVNASILGDLLGVGRLGFVAGVALPLAFRLVGYVLDMVKAVVRS